MASTPKSDSMASSLLTNQYRIQQQVRSLGQLITQRQLDRAEIGKRTTDIGRSVLASSRVMKSANFTSTTAADLQRMADMYDAMFFDSKLLTIAREHSMSFRWSSRMTSAGGKTIRSVHRARGARTSRVSYEIALSATLLFQTFGDLDRPIRVTGHVCENRLQAMQRILEHELIHLAKCWCGTIQIVRRIAFKPSRIDCSVTPNTNTNWLPSMSARPRSSIFASARWSHSNTKAKPSSAKSIASRAAPRCWSPMPKAKNTTTVSATANSMCP